MQAALLDVEMITAENVYDITVSVTAGPIAVIKGFCSTRSTDGLPCLLLVDEADGILGTVTRRGTKKHVRTMLARFVQPWDGAADQNTKR